MLEQLNRFIRTHKIVKVDNELVQNNHSAYWSFCVTYIDTRLDTQPVYSGERREKTDYKNVLDEEHFKVFSQLRMYRKQIAEKDAVPAYAVFTDAELAAMAKADNLTEKTVLAIDGIGKKRMEKYGAMLIGMFRHEDTPPEQHDNV